MRFLSSFVFLWMALLSFACTKSESKSEVWIYTSLFKDTVADLQPKLEQAFPEIKVQFFQAGSEDVAAKINAEELAGGTKADIAIFSDRFWFEEMAEKGKFVSYLPKGAEKVEPGLKHPGGFYSALSLPVTVLAYNSEVISEDQAPKSFKDLTDAKWAGKFSTGSPLASGTNFTTMAFLQEKYGWEYFKALKNNKTISEGGNSSVLRRIQTKERPIGWVLLENVLRFQSSSNLKIIYPSDGVVIQSNNLAILKKSASQENAKVVADWLFGENGQKAMVKSFMYSVTPGFEAPKGALPLSEIQAKSKPWTQEFISKTMKDRESLKENFTKIMFQ